jgi:hypothetical protein
MEISCAEISFAEISCADLWRGAYMRLPSASRKPAFSFIRYCKQACIAHK